MICKTRGLPGFCVELIPANLYNYKGMKIEWWMLDGIVILIVLLSAIIGMKRGIGDTILRLIGLVGGLVLAAFFGKDFSAYLMKTPFKNTVYERVFTIMRPEPDNLSKTVPGPLGTIADDAANKAAAAAAERVTESLMGVIAFVGIVLAVWLASFIIRTVFKRGRKKSVIIGGTDSLIGLALGIVKGVIVACLFVSALLPGTALFAPDKSLEMINALQDSQLTKLIYELNPLLTALKGAVGLK